MSSRASSDLRPRRRDSGMTLPELLVSITILGIVIASITAAVVVVLRNERPTAQRLAESKDISFLQTWIPADLASALTSNTDPLHQPSGAASLPGTNVLTVTRPVNVQNPTGPTVVVSYRYVKQNDEWQLRRYEISGASSSTPVVTQVGVAHELAAPPPTWTADQSPTHAVRVTARNQVVLSPIGEDVQVVFSSGGVFTTGGSGLSGQDQLPTDYSGGTVDPAAPPSRCGGTVTLVLDTSSSIPNQAGATHLVNAALGFIDAFTGTPTFLRIVGFDVSAYSFYPTTIGQYVNILNPSSSLDAMRNKVIAQGQSGARWGGGTNWEDGLWQAFRNSSGTPFAQLPELVVFVSDGEPNRNRSNYSGDGDTRFHSTDLSRAVTAAGYGRGTGARIVGVLVGNDASTTNQDRMRSVVGTVTWNGTGPTNPGNAAAADFFLPANSASFSQLGNVMRAITAAQCGGTVTLQKRIETNGQSSEASGTWNYTTDVGVRELNLDTSSSITFDYTFPSGVTSRSVQITETPRDGFVFVRADCSVAGNPLPSNRVSAPYDGSSGVVVTLAPDEAVSCVMVSRPT